VFGQRHQLLSLSAVKRVRLLAAILLASIAWGATAESTHNHGVRTQTALNQTAGANSSLNADDSIQSSNTSSSSSRSRSPAECLICQLHQNLSSSEINQPSLVGGVESQLSFRPTNVAVNLFEFADTRRGRAPPIIL
jgi:hypothetical protein